jgi:hypothetical protein
VNGRANIATGHRIVQCDVAWVESARHSKDARTYSTQHTAHSTQHTAHSTHTHTNTHKYTPTHAAS